MRRISLSKYLLTLSLIALTLAGVMAYHGARAATYSTEGQCIDKKARTGGQPEFIWESLSRQFLSSVFYK
ncbi:MAG TPA: hypothetical protein VHK69_15140 [Chitinophagaceae bacterium]|jgi:hypothetical protein|nr:hypothetical protein [Chitinophagaceae bacterium]